MLSVESLEESINTKLMQSLELLCADWVVGSRKNRKKEAVVRKARKEKREGLFICEDLSQATLEKRKPHLEKLKAAKQAGKSAYFILDRLIIHDKPSGSSND